MQLIGKAAAAFKQSIQPSSNTCSRLEPAVGTGMTDPWLTRTPSINRKRAIYPRVADIEAVAQALAFCAAFCLASCLSDLSSELQTPIYAGPGCRSMPEQFNRTVRPVWLRVLETVAGKAHQSRFIHELLRRAPANVTVKNPASPSVWLQAHNTCRPDLE